MIASLVWPKFIRQLPNEEDDDPGLSTSPGPTPPSSPSTEGGMYLSDRLDVDVGTSTLKSAMDGTSIAQ